MTGNIFRDCWAYVVFGARLLAEYWYVWVIILLVLFIGWIASAGRPRG